MKFTKLSLVAAIAVSSAFAGGDIAPVEPAPVVETSPWSFSGDAKLYYSTDSSTMFDQANSNGQAAISADVGYAINSNWKINVGMTGLMTLGLDDTIVGGTWLWAGADATNGASPVGTSVGDALWFDTANITGTMFDGKLTMVLGRQALDTPLAFSETWNIAPNTFDAAVAIAKPMENLSLIAGYIYDGNGNGGRIATFDGDGPISGEGGFTHSNGYVPVNIGGPNEISDGAWTVAAVGTFAGVTAQAWYYDVIDVANAVWLQADGEFSGFTLGAQYAWISADSKLETALGAKSEDASAWAVKAGYKMDALNLWAAYSSASDNSNPAKFVLPVANTATIWNGASGPVSFGWGSQAGGQSKLYTEAWWNYGLVGQAGADTFAAAAEYNVGDLAMFNGVQATLQYTNVDGAKIFGDPTNAVDMQEVTALVGAKVYNFNVQLAYIWSQVDNYNTITNTTLVNGDNTDTVQLYLTYNF